MVDVQGKTQKDTCPICLWEPVAAEWFEHKKDVSCPACGHFRIGSDFNQWLWAQRDNGPLTDNQLSTLHRLSAAIRHAASPPFITFASWEVLADEAPTFSISTKLLRLLEFCGKQAVPGEDFDLTLADGFRSLVPLLAASGSKEVSFLLDHLIAGGLLNGDTYNNGDVGGVRLTVAGWQRLEPLAGGIPGRVFVAMWFDPSMEDAWLHGFRAAIEDCGLDPRRIDKLAFANKICDQILAEIRAAEIVVADVTGFRSGVFFEAGFAMWPGKTVILTCREDAFADLTKHFDTRQYPHLGWSDPLDLRRRLADRIRALRDVPTPF